MIRSRHAPLALFVAALAAGAATRAEAVALLPNGFRDELVADSLNFPIAMAFLPDGRLLVTEKDDARIRVVVKGGILNPPVAVIDSVRVTSESGLLGIAVDPGWPARPYLYTMYNWSGGPWMRLIRLTATGDLTHTGGGVITADPSAEYLILADLQDFQIVHNGGTLRFGPDGMLYVSLGDDVWDCSAPDLTRLVGKILRLDVSGLPPGPGLLDDYALISPPDNPFAGHADLRARLVWAYALRNPWNYHFDPPTGRMFIADVGAGSFEEISMADSPGIKFGWPWYEGYARYWRTCNLADSAGSRAPIHAYDRRSFETGAAVISGGVYRRPPGPAPNAFPPAYEGIYFFSDLGAGFLRRLRESNGAWVLADSVPGQPNASDWATGMDYVTDYLTGPDGALWYVKYFARFEFYSGEIRRIAHDGVTSAPRAPPAGLALDRPFPAPARGGVTIGYSLARPAPVRLTVHDLAGRAIRTLLAREAAPAGRGSTRWDGHDEQGRAVPAGVYIVRLATPEGALSRRCVIVR